MEWVYDDGGRSQYFKAERVGDCCCRAISIATESDYKEIYDKINKYSYDENVSKHRRQKKSNAREGVFVETAHRIFNELGWTWHPTMKIGSGCTVHMREDELPKGRIVARVSRHYVAIIDGVVHDTYDCTRDGSRCVYGYWSQN